MKASVIVVTYNRPVHIERCVESLLGQRRTPDEIIIVVRSEDMATQKVLEKYHGKSVALPVKIVIVTEAGIVYAENQGLKAAVGDIVCFLDDDATAPENWINDTLRHYEQDPSIGGVGGPVVQVIDGKPIIQRTNVFSRITWLGRRITNTTKIPTEIQEVDLLRGANMSFRRAVIKEFDDRLLPYWRRFEDDICLSVKEGGYKLICDPALKVLHFDAETHADLNIDKTPKTIVGLHHNSIYVKLKHFKGFRKLAMVLCEFMWGDLTCPGFFQFIGYGIKHRTWSSFSELAYAMAGKTRGVFTYLCAFFSVKERDL